MEVSAVPMLGVARPKRVAPAPAGAGLVIFHGGKGVIVKRAAFIQIRHARLYLRSGQFGGLAGDGHQFVRLQEALKIFVRGRALDGNRGQMFQSHDVVFNSEVIFGLSGFVRVGVKHLVSVLRLSGFFEREIPTLGKHLHLLEFVRLGHREPDIERLAGIGNANGE